MCVRCVRVACHACAFSRPPSLILFSLRGCDLRHVASLVLSQTWDLGLGLVSCYSTEDACYHSQEAAEVALSLVGGSEPAVICGSVACLFLLTRSRVPFPHPPGHTYACNINYACSCTDPPPAFLSYLIKISLDRGFPFFFFFFTFFFLPDVVDPPGIF